MNFSRRLIPWLLALTVALSSLLTSCSLEALRAQDRVFLDLSLDFIGEYKLPKQKFKDTTVGGLSGITYDRKRDRFYAISDDRSKLAPARFYTLKLNLNSTGIQNVKVEKVTFLTDKNGNTYPKSTTDTEGIAYAPPKSLFISSEGVAHKGIPPFVNEFDLETGRLKQSLPIPKRYLPELSGNKIQNGIQDNLGFEALTINPTGSLPASGEPIRLFTATESALVQDKEPENSENAAKCRVLHYLLSDGPPVLLSEHVYQLDPAASGVLKHGLPDLLAIDQSGHFLSLERYFDLGLPGFNAKIFQVTTGGATDTSNIASLKGDIKDVASIQKKLLLDLTQLGITLDNLEGMALGPRLPDGSQSLIVVSDDNFAEAQTTQFLLFRLKM